MDNLNVIPMLDLDINNIGVYCTGYQCLMGRQDSIALKWISASNEISEFTYQELDTDSNKAANIIRQLIGNDGERVAIFLPKIYELFICILGSLKARAIACPLFSNFGEDALIDRLSDSTPKLLITKNSYLKKIEKIKGLLPSIKYILVTDIENDIDSNVLSFNRLLLQSTDHFYIGQTPIEAPSLLHYTSGSTGKPKGVLHRHKAIESILYSGRKILGLTPEDTYWCTADQAWITGTSYGILAPWGIGVTQLQYSGSFDPDSWYSILDKQKINIWYTAPTALRMLMQHPLPNREIYKFDALNQVFSVGEPLNPEVFHWGRKAFNKDIHDTWFQTETGSILISNRPGLEIKPGSMGKPLENIQAEIISKSGQLDGPQIEGNLCIRTPWPSMFVEYWGKPEAYINKFQGGYYFTGDLAKKDETGYFWFIGRSDDVINTSGHLVSPFEVESALLELPEISDCGVIAAPDELLFECVVAFVKISSNVIWNKDLELKIKTHIAKKVSAIATPKVVIAIDSIPKNRSGKIMRRVLKAKYLGLDIGDISTLEEV